MMTCVCTHPVNSGIVLGYGKRVDDGVEADQLLARRMPLERTERAHVRGHIALPGGRTAQQRHHFA